MHLTKYLLPALFVLFLNPTQAQEKYKVLMDDANSNFYDACKESETHFEGKFLL